MSVNQQLMHAIEQHDVAEVHFLLEKSADPNYEIPFDPQYPDREHQPWSPLRMVVFRISDNLLEEKDLMQFHSIARLLLEYGADPVPALELADSRYGKYHAGVAQTPFTAILKLLDDAASKK